MTYRSAWWSVELPPGWQAYSDVDCSTFRSDPALGVLQISAARKDAGLMTDGDLKEFAEDRIGPAVRLESVRLGSFCGFTAQYRKKGLAWREWWLRSEQLMVYATYNVVARKEFAEQNAVEAILASLVNTTEGSGLEEASA